VQPHPENGLHVEIRHHQVFFELSAANQQLPALIKDQAAAVEHEFILPSDQVAEGDDGHVSVARVEIIFSRSADFPAW